MYKLLSIALLLISVRLIAQNITATQNIPKNAMPGAEFIIETTINKSKTNGFMKFAQDMPEGFTPIELESKAGAFTFADNKAKIVWITPPTEEIFTIKYKVSVSSNCSVGLKSLSGKISYIYNNERKTTDLEGSILIGEAITLPAVHTIPKPSEKPSPKNEVAKAKQKKPTTAIKENHNKVPSNVMYATTGKTYRVQIGAFSSKPDIHGIYQITTVVLDNGITKYFSGNFANYEDAMKRKKEIIAKGYPDAFIVVFENGRIVK